MAAEFSISDVYLNPRLYKSTESGYLKECQDDPDLKAQQRQQATVNLIAERLEGKEEPAPELIVRHENFDPLYQLSCDFLKVSKKPKGQIVQTLCTAVPVLLAKIRALPAGASSPEKTELRNAVKMLSFLLCLIVNLCVKEYGNQKKTRKKKGGRSLQFEGESDDDEKSSRKKGSSALNWNWESQKEKLISTLVAVVECTHVKSLWNMSTPEDEFGNMLFKTGVVLFESPENLKSKDISLALHRFLAITISQYNLLLTFPPALVHLIMTQDNAPTHVADLCKVLANEYNRPIVVGNIVREIGRLDHAGLSRDVRGAKNIATFLRELADRTPKLVHKDMAVILPHLDGESYLVRNGVIELLGKLIKGAFPREANEDAQRTKWREVEKRRLLDLLSERVLDVMSYTRSKTLQVWTELFSEDQIPLRGVSDVIALARSRLHDRTSIVRKRSLALLTVILQNNPFGPDLSLDKYEPRFEELRTRMKEIADAAERLQLEGAKRYLNAQDDNSAAKRLFGGDDSADAEQGDGDKVKQEDEDVVIPDTQDNGSDDMRDEDDDNEEADARREEEAEAKAEEQKDPLQGLIPPEEFAKLQTELMWFAAATRFIKDIEACVPDLCVLMTSRTPTDVMETINFFIVASEFNIRTWKEGFQRMLPLVWMKEPSTIRTAVLGAYHHHYIGDALARMDENAPEAQAEALRIAANLSKLADATTLRDYTCIEELFFLLTDAANGDENSRQLAIPKVVFGALWNLFAHPNGQTDVENLKISRNALLVLSMAAAARPKLIQAHMRDVVEIGLGEKAESDPHLMRVAFLAIERVSTTKGIKFPPELVRAVTRRAVQLVRGGLVKGKHWFSACVQAISTLFAFYRRPAKLFERLVREMAADTFSSQSNKGQDHEKSPEEKSDAMEDSPASSAFPSPSPSPPLGSALSQADPPVPVLTQGKNRNSGNDALSKFLFVLGQVALKLLVDLEKVESDLKKTRHNKDKLERKRTEDDQKGSEDIEAELGFGDGEKDHEIETARERAEKEMVSQGLLGCFAPIVVAVCRNPQLFSGTLLRSSAVLALSKFMCISRDFCDKNLNLLFTILQEENDKAVRANIVISLGDMAFRFPNLLAPWSPKMYAPLRDKDISVRKNTLMVLSHLILNDMIKVKDSISEIALLINDREAPIKDLSKLFFQELSKKGKNPIYNILPDTISRLSSDAAVSGPSFQSILKELMKYITIEKQQENLVRQLCNRFNATKETSQHRDIAFCLALLPYTERCIRKISEAPIMKTYMHLLADDVVYDRFKVIISKAKKVASKQEVKDVIAEYEKKITEIREKRAEEQEADDRAAAEKGKKRGKEPRPGSALSQASGRGSRKGGRRKRTAAPQQEYDSTDEDEDGEDDDQELKLESDDDNEEDEEAAASEDDDEQGAKKRPSSGSTRRSPRRAKKIRKAAPPPPESSDEDEDDEDDDEEDFDEVADTQDQPEDDEDDEEEETSSSSRRRGGRRAAAAPKAAATSGRRGGRKNAVTTTSSSSRRIRKPVKRVAPKRRGGRRSRRVEEESDNESDSDSDVDMAEVPETEPQNDSDESEAEYDESDSE